MLRWRLWSVDCCMSLWFPAVLVVLLTLDSTPLGLLCLLASAVHECGHFLAMLVVDDRPARLCFGAFGVRVERHPESVIGYGKQALVSMAGPGANLLCGVALWLVTGVSDGVLVHMILGSFHLLPILSLDGGEALYSLLCCRISEQRAHGIVLIISVAVLLPLAVLGFWLLLDTGYNFSLLLLTGYLISLLIFKEKH